MFINNTSFKVIFSWLALIVIVLGSLGEPLTYEKTAFEDSIELEKEIEDGERELELLPTHSYQLEQIDIAHKLASTFQHCEENLTKRSTQKLYLMHHQLKNHLG